MLQRGFTGTPDGGAGVLACANLNTYCSGGDNLFNTWAQSVISSDINVYQVKSTGIHLLSSEIEFKLGGAYDLQALYTFGEGIMVIPNTLNSTLNAAGHQDGKSASGLLVCPYQHKCCKMTF